MVQSNLEKILIDFTTYYGITLKGLISSFDNKVPTVQLSGKSDSISGLRNIVSQVSNPDDIVCNAIQDQWVEYVLTHVGRIDILSASQIFKELNAYLINKVYFVGNQLGPVDILMYYLLYSVMSSLTFYEKEKFIHLSRWFNCVQNDKNAKLRRPVIPFSRSLLYV